jgi:hypothetical protein
MSKLTKDKSKGEIIIPGEKLEYLQRELTNIREDFVDNKYIREAINVLAAGGLRSTIGCCWNAVVDDLRKKVIHRSLDLFNKEINPKRQIKTYEDFQNFITDFELIDGAYKIGVIGWEAHKLLHQARETRNIFDGHPDSSDPTLFKVFNMIADCNRYVLSEEYPLPIIDVNQYILTMDSDSFNKNEIAIEQAFTDLPEIYKEEMTNRLFTLYIGDNASTRLKSNIEFGYPVLWKVISKEIRQQIGKRFDKLIVEGNSLIIEMANDLLTIVDGLRYVSAASRKILFEPAIKDLEDNLDQWGAESRAVQHLQRLGTTIPKELIGRLVNALTLTFVGYRGGSFQYSRTIFFSNAAAPKISEMFEKFDNASAEAFIETMKTNEKLKGRIKHADQLNRLRTLGQILLNKPEIRDDTKEFLEVLVDVSKTKEFYISLQGK